MNAMKNGEDKTDQNSSDIHHVSDTALWVATYRAIESERPDALFKDPLAKKLTGERGYRIAKMMSKQKLMAYVMAIRTISIDQLIEQTIADGIDTVINLGAGLDTRPYRMNLPKDFRWIEVDFPDIIQYKNSMLATETPVCRLERISCDLSQDTARIELFNRLGSETRKALVITEGVIPYLPSSAAKTLSRNLHSVSTFAFWIQDFSQGKSPLRRANAFSKKLKHSPFLFDSEDQLGFFGEDGWKIERTIMMTDEGERRGRKFPFIFPWSLLLPFAPKSWKRIARAAYGYALLKR